MGEIKINIEGNQYEFKFDETNKSITYTLNSKKLSDLIKPLEDKDWKPIEEVSLSPEIQEYLRLSFVFLKNLWDQKDFIDFFSLSDYLFGEFVSLWTKFRKEALSIQAKMLWGKIIEIVENWEKEFDFSIYKHTPYYFFGASFFLESNLEYGLALIHKSWEEEKNRTVYLKSPELHYDSPSYYTLSLINKSENVLYEFIKGSIESLKTIIENYNFLYGKTFDYPTFEKKFLNNKNLEEEKFFFVYTVYHLVLHSPLQDSRYKNTSFVSHRNISLITNLCLVIEVLLTYIFRGGDGELFSNISWYNSDKTILPENYNKDASNKERESLKQLISINRLDPKDPSFIFSRAIRKLLNNRIYMDGKLVDKELNLLILVWILRNYGSHKIGVENIITEKYPDIIENLFYALFLICEKIPA